MVNEDGDGMLGCLERDSARYSDSIVEWFTIAAMANLPMHSVRSRAMVIVAVPVCAGQSEHLAPIKASGTKLSSASSHPDVARLGEIRPDDDRNILLRWHSVRCTASTMPNSWPVSAGSPSPTSASTDRRLDVQCAEAYLRPGAEACRRDHARETYGPNSPVTCASWLSLCL